MADFWFQFLLALDSTIRVATPLIFCAMAGIFSERSGIIDISLEGKMLMAAFVAAAVAYGTGSPWIGALAAIIVSVLAGLLHGFACIIHRGNQVISGLAINILASGLTVIIGIAAGHRHQDHLVILISISRRVINTCDGNRLSRTVVIRTEDKGTT